MRLRFYGDLWGLEDGIRYFAPKLGFSWEEDGLPVRVMKQEGDLEVSFHHSEGMIRFAKKAHFFRALGLFIEAMRERPEFTFTEKPQFETLGVMFDASQNAVLKPESLRELTGIMALMGFNMLMLYTSNTYTVENRPYFGYLRGRYTRQELKECDDFADMLGIEMIPAIQTLGHLTGVLKWNFAKDLRDTPDILLAGNDATYDFIEEMLTSATAPFRSSRIHIGMDEAHNIGLGRYLRRNGYQRRFDIMSMHLKNVTAITSRLGLRPMIWSDMYFRLASATGEYYDRNARIPQDVMDTVPRDVQLVYWDYYHDDAGFYADFIRRHKAFGSMPVFAGGIWTWAGMTVNYGKSFAATNAALRACKQEKVREVICTLWGDNGAETNVYGALLGLQLYAEHGYAPGVDEEKLRKRFAFCTGGDYDDFMGLRWLDEAPGTEKDNGTAVNPSKYLLWQDPMMGLFDRDTEELGLSGYYDGLAERYARRKNEKWNFVFEVPRKLASVLAIKSDIGIRIRRYYAQKDSAALETVVHTELPELRKRVEELRIAHREQWMSRYKPFGWEILDIRYGGLLARLDTAESRLGEYLEGKTSVIEELEVPLLPFDRVGNERYGHFCRCNEYTRIISACGL